MSLDSPWILLTTSLSLLFSVAAHSAQSTEGLFHHLLIELAQLLLDKDTVWVFLVWSRDPVLEKWRDLPRLRRYSWFCAQADSIACFLLLKTENKVLGKRSWWWRQSNAVIASLCLLQFLPSWLLLVNILKYPSESVLILFKVSTDNCIRDTITAAFAGVDTGSAKLHVMPCPPSQVQYNREAGSFYQPLNSC